MLLMAAGLKADACKQTQAEVSKCKLQEKHANARKCKQKVSKCKQMQADGVSVFRREFPFAIWTPSAPFGPPSAPFGPPVLHLDPRVLHLDARSLSTGGIRRERVSARI